MIDAHDVAEVDRLVRLVAEREILPRFGHLRSADIKEKAPGDLVTVADQAAETALSQGLTAILPGSVVVGEEGVSTDPSVLKRLDDDAPVWIVDAIDGTHNFVAENSRYSTLVALAHRGALLASWTYIPVFDTMATATAGGGAFVDGQQVRVRESQPSLRFLDTVAPHPRYWAGDIGQAQFNALGGSGVSLSFYDLAGLEYIELASGRRGAMVVTWENVWDHAAGLLLHAEAGGTTKTLDGSAFRLTGSNALPFVVAPDEATATALCDVLASPAARG